VDRVGWWNITRQTTTNMQGYLAFMQRGSIPVPTVIPAPMTGSGITIPGRIFALEIMIGDLT